MKDPDPVAEPIAQNLIKLISNVCFSVFVFSVLVVTVVAITYQPPDPWLQSAPALTRLFTQTQNATFKNDDSVLKTGEDLPLLLPPAASPAPAPAPPAAAAAVERAEEVIANSTPRAEPSCDEAALLPVNCSDPRVLAAVKRFNARAFRSIVFLGYQAPVNGSKADECDTISVLANSIPPPQRNCRHWNCGRRRENGRKEKPKQESTDKLEISRSNDRQREFNRDESLEVLRSRLQRIIIS